MTNKGDMKVKDDIELQNLWIALQKKPWRVLAIVSASTDGESIDVAKALAEAGFQFEGVRPAVTDLRDLKLRLVENEKKRMEQAREKNEPVVLALASPDKSPAGLAIARAADAVVVTVRLGETPMKVLARAADEIGRDKMLGAVVVHPRPRPALAPAAPTPKPASAEIIPTPIIATQRVVSSAAVSPRKTLKLGSVAPGAKS